MLPKKLAATSMKTGNLSAQGKKGSKRADISTALREDISIAL